MPTTLAKRKKKPVPSNANVGTFSEPAMDDYLAKRNLYRKPIAKDGSCLFRAVSEQVYNCQARHLDVRRDCIQFMSRNREQFEEFVEGPFDHHLHQLQNPKEWAGQVEITAIAMMYKKDFVVYQDINSAPTKVTDYGFKDKILLCYSNGNHYDAVYPAKYKKDAAFCQSLVYELLYNNVFTELDKRETNSLKRNTSSGQKTIIEMVRNGDMVADSESQDSTEDEGWTQVKSRSKAKVARQVKPVEQEERREREEVKPKPNQDQKWVWELKRSLDVELFRNVALEVWEEDKNEQNQQDLAMATSLQFRNGDKCLAKLGPPSAPVEKNYAVIVKEDYTGSGSILVYVHELKERLTVPIQCLKPSDVNQDPSYRDLSGYYKKNETPNGSASEGDLKDDKNKKKRPPRNRRGVGRGDEPGSFTDDGPRGRGGRGFGRRGGRFGRGRDDKLQKDDEEARFIAEQLQLVEIQEKDPKAFPALPVRSGGTPVPQPPPPAADSIPTPPQPQPPATSPEVEEVPVQLEQAPSVEAGQEPSPAEFWSRLKNAKTQSKQTDSSPSTSKPATPVTSPTEGKQSHSQLPADKGQASVVEEDSDNGSLELSDIVDKGPLSIQSLNRLNDEQKTEQFHDAPQIKPMAVSSSVAVKNCNKPDFDKGPADYTPSTDEENHISDYQQLSEKPKNELNKNVIAKEGMSEKTDILMSNEPKKNELSNNDQIKFKRTKAFEDTTRKDSQRQSPLKDDLPKDESLTVQKSFSDEIPIKRPMPKSVLVTENSGNSSPERKTVTFADEPKEIPSKTNNQPGILYVNGANNLSRNRINPVPSEPADDIKRDTAFKGGYNIPLSFAREENASPQNNVYKPYKDLEPKSFTVSHVDSDMDPSTTLSLDAETEGDQQADPQGQAQFLQMPYHGGLPPAATPSLDPTGADLPQDMTVLRFFYNFGYQQYMQMLQMNQPMVYMHPAAMPDQMMQPVTSMYTGIPQQLYQHQGLQSYHQPYQVPTSSQESPIPTDIRNTDRTAHTPQQSQPTPQPHQHQQQQQQPHHQIHLTQPHFQAQFQPPNGQQTWRGPRPHFSSNNKQYYSSGQHGGSPQAPRPSFHQNTGNLRQQHFNQKPRRSQSKGHRNEQFMPHYNSASSNLLVNHSQAMGAPPQGSYYSVAGDQSKGQGDVYAPSPQPLYGYQHQAPGTTRPQYN
ncbi:uncharacterized protein LOC5516416 [Nematostella vectensis]|nr:uncharacterized protein LOC5516416 [Nematostella vectensis]